MTTIRRHRRPDRHAHQQTVAALLDQLGERRRRLYLLRTAGVGPAALHELETELHELRQALAAAIADKTTTLPRPGQRAKQPTPPSAVRSSVATIENPPTMTTPRRDDARAPAALSRALERAR